MKKLFILFTSLSMILTFIGCDINDPINTTTNTETNSEKDNLLGSVLSGLIQSNISNEPEYTKCTYIPTDGIRSEYQIKNYIINDNTITLTLEDNSSIILSGNYILQ